MSWCTSYPIHWAMHLLYYIFAHYTIHLTIYQLDYSFDLGAVLLHMSPWSSSTCLAVYQLYCAFDHHNVMVRVYVLFSFVVSCFSCPWVTSLPALVCFLLWVIVCRVPDCFPLCPINCTFFKPWVSLVSCRLIVDVGELWWESVTCVSDWNELSNCLWVLLPPPQPDRMKLPQMDSVDIDLCNPSSGMHFID